MDSDGIPKLSEFFGTAEPDSSGGAVFAGAPTGRAESSATSAWTPTPPGILSSSTAGASIQPNAMFRMPAVVSPPPPSPAPSVVGSRGMHRQESRVSNTFASPEKMAFEPDEDGSDDGRSPQPIDEVKTDYWVGRNDIYQITGGSLLGVAEHQAELWIKKMVTHDASYPHQKKYHFDIARMKTHLRKVTLVKKMRHPNIFALSNEDLQVCVDGLGQDFEYPSLTTQHLLARRIANERGKAFAASGDATETWTNIVNMLKPRGVSEENHPFLPLAPTLMCIRATDLEAAQILIDEAVTNSLLHLIVMPRAQGEQHLRDLTRALTEVFESHWVQMSEVMTNAVADVMMCCRVIALLLGEVLDADGDAFDELKKLRSSSAQDAASSPMVYTVSCALTSHEEYGVVMQELITKEKNIIKARPSLRKRYEELGAVDAVSVDTDHCQAISKASDLLVHWASRVLPIHIDPLRTLVRARLLGCSSLVLAARAEGEEKKSIDSTAYSELMKTFEIASNHFSLDEEVATQKQQVFEQFEGLCKENAVDALLTRLDEFSDNFKGVVSGEAWDTMRETWGASVDYIRFALLDLKGVKLEETLVARIDVVATLALDICEENFERSHAEVNQCYEMVFVFELSKDKGLQRRARLVLAASTLMEAVYALEHAAIMDTYKMALQVKQKISALNSALTAGSTEEADAKVEVEVSVYVAELITIAEDASQIAFKSEYNLATEEVKTTLEIAEGFAPWNTDIEKTATLEEVQKVWEDAKISAHAVKRALTATLEAGASLRFFAPQH